MQLGPSSCKDSRNGKKLCKILKILDTDLSIGDEFLLKLILRPYDPEEGKNNKEKDKKCKKGDRCIDLKFKIVE